MIAIPHLKSGEYFFYLENWTIINFMNILFLLVSMFGMIDAGYLTRQHYLGGTLVCPIFGGCDVVTNSVYSEILGFPVAGIGLAFYMTIFSLSALAYFTENKLFLKLASYLTICGLLASIALVSLMLFIIKALCFYCVLSAISSTVLFILGMIFLRREWKTKNSPKDSDKI